MITVRIDVATAAILAFILGVVTTASVLAIASAAHWGVSFSATMSDGDVHRIVGCIRDLACH
jgi:hypothetical protein